jgi:hypothetical protein
MKAHNAWATVVALIPLMAVVGGASADHINNGFATEVRPPGSVVIHPAPATPLPPVVVQPGQPIIVQQSGQPAPPATVAQPASRMVQVEDLEANEVRAHTIYANKIEAPEIQGTIHSTAKVRLDDSVSDLKAATVVTSLLYADTIKAHRVIADHIFVRELERH